MFRWIPGVQTQARDFFKEIGHCAGRERTLCPSRHLLGRAEVLAGAPPVNGAEKTSCSCDMCLGPPAAWLNIQAQAPRVCTCGPPARHCYLSVRRASVTETTAVSVPVCSHAVEPWLGYCCLVNTICLASKAIRFAATHQHRLPSCITVLLHASLWTCHVLTGHVRSLAGCCWLSVGLSGAGHLNVRAACTYNCSIAVVCLALGCYPLQSTPC